MKLESLILPQKVVTFDFPGAPGLTFDLAFLSKEENQKIVKACTKTKINSRTRQPEKELDEDMFLKAYVAEVVKGWKGFKVKYLANFIIYKDTAADPEDEVEFDEDSALYLMKNSAVFDSWVSDQISDLGKFTASS
jgi:hypothetical protein